MSFGITLPEIMYIVAAAAVVVAVVLVSIVISLNSNKISVKYL